MMIFNMTMQPKVHTWILHSESKNKSGLNVPKWSLLHSQGSRKPCSYTYQFNQGNICMDWLVIWHCGFTLSNRVSSTLQKILVDAFHLNKIDLCMYEHVPSLRVCPHVVHTFTYTFCYPCFHALEPFYVQLPLYK